MVCPDKEEFLVNSINNSNLIIAKCLNKQLDDEFEDIIRADGIYPQIDPFVIWFNPARLP